MAAETDSLTTLPVFAPALSGLAGICTLSDTGLDIPLSLTDEQLKDIGDKIGIGHTLSDWMLADIALALTARACELPDAVAKRLGCNADTAQKMAGIAQEWPQAEREPGVPPFVHSQVYHDLIKPLGTNDARSKGHEILRQWKTGVVGPQNLRRTLATLQKECREAMQPRLMEVEKQAKLTKEVKGEDGLTGWETIFIRHSAGSVILITVGTNGEQSILRRVDSQAFARFLESIPIEDTAKTWESLAHKVFLAEESEAKAEVKP